MKKIFTLAMMAIMSSSVFAQLQTGWVDPELVGYDAEGKTLTTAIDADVVLASSPSVKMKNAYAVNYKIASLTAEADVANTVTIAGNEIDLSANSGIQGQTNPAPNSVGTVDTEYDNCIGGQTSGSVLKFEVSESGYLFVFHKATYNKNYFAWDGFANLGSAYLMAIRHIGQPVSEANGSMYDYTMPYDDLGYTLASQVTTTIKVKSGEKDAEGNDIMVEQLSLKQLYQLLPEGNYTAGNALSVIAIPVNINGDATYFVNACGSKITTNGFAFLPDSNPTVDGLKEISVTFSKSGESAVAGIAEAKAEAAAPVKVITANGIQIGKYNVAGQQVK